MIIVRSLRKILLHSLPRLIIQFFRNAQNSVFGLLADPSGSGQRSGYSRPRHNGYLLNITLHDNRKIIEENIITQLAGHRIDGLILHPASRDEANYDYLKKMLFPTVIIGGNRLKDWSFVGNNEAEAAAGAGKFAAMIYHVQQLIDRFLPDLLHIIFNRR